jgi:hypothetical protein
MAKLCEKVAARCQTADLEERNCPPVQVGGARPGRSTTDNVEAVTHSIAQSLQQTKCAAIATYDLEDAYNKVDIRILADKLTKLGVSTVMVEIDCDTARMQKMSDEVWEVAVSHCHSQLWSTTGLFTFCCTVQRLHV